jgi:hypothetical protein
MAKTTSTEGKSKTDIVRDYIRSNPTATGSQIAADLKAYGISLALAQKTKYTEGLKRRRGAKKRSPASGTRTQPANGAATSSKADAIRDVAASLPKPVRPRDVIAELAEKGITVSNAQVGQVLKGMGMRRRKRRSRRRQEVVATVASTLTLESLIAAKKLAVQLGGVGAAKQAVDALAKLS